MRSKTRVLSDKIENLSNIPDWNYDGSSCMQASTQNSEVILKPVSYYRDPFRKAPNVIVLCESYVFADKTFTKLAPANTNFREGALKVFNSTESDEPWFGIEQEYSLLYSNTPFNIQPLGWPEQGFPGPQGPFYCSVGA